MGFGHAQSERAVRLYGTVHAALDALLSGKGKFSFFLKMVGLRACQMLANPKLNEVEPWKY